MMMSVIYNDMSYVDDSDSEVENKQNNKATGISTVSQTIDKEKGIKPNLRTKSDSGTYNYGYTQDKLGSPTQSCEKNPKTQLCRSKSQPVSMSEGNYIQTVSYAVDNGVNNNKYDASQKKDTNCE